MGFIPLWSGVSAANGKPSGATAGMPLAKGADGSKTGYGFTIDADEALLLLWNTDVDSETKEVTGRLWIYFSKIGHGENAMTVNSWFPIGTGADATKGTINAGSAMGETDTDIVRHAEVISNIEYGERVYLEYVSGTGTYSACLISSKKRPA